MRADPSLPASPRLDREYAEFLLALSAAFQRAQIYPGGHPTVDRAVDAVVRRLSPLLDQLPAIALAVSPLQLTMGDAATDPGHPQLRELAARLFRRNVGLVRLTRGINAAGVNTLLRALSGESGPCVPPRTPHVEVELLDFGGLVLRDAAGERTGAVWTGLARSMLGDPAALERLLSRREPGSPHHPVLGDVLDLAEAPVALDLLLAAARVEQRTLSPALVQLLTKLASHADAGPPPSRRLADAEFREALQELIEGWSAPDAGETERAYQHTLDHLPVPGAPDLDPTEVYRSDPLRIVTMHLDMGELGPPVARAVRTLVARGEIRPLADLLERMPRPDPLADRFRTLVATADALAALLSARPVDLGTLERLAPEVGVAAIPPLLDALATSDDRGVRRRVLELLARFGNAVTPHALIRLAGAPWFVQRNLLRLLQTLPEPPAEAEIAGYARDPDPRVRVEGLRLLLQLPASRTRGIVQGLGDGDPVCQRVAVLAALDGCPAAAAPLLIRGILERSLDSELRPPAIRALAELVDDPSVLEMLLRLAGRRIPLYGLMVSPRSRDGLTALAGLARHWRWHPKTARLLARAERHRDPEIRSAVSGPTVLEQLGLVEALQ